MAYEIIGVYLAWQLILGFAWFASDLRAGLKTSLLKAHRRALKKFWVAVDQLFQIMLAPFINLIFNPPYRWGQSVDHTISYCLAKNVGFWRGHPLGGGWYLTIKFLEWIDPNHMQDSIHNEERENKVNRL